MATRTLYLLDALALAYRAHFAFINRPLINSKGRNTSATYGFVNTMLKLIEDHGLDHVAVVFDLVGEGGTFRDEIYADYKAHRDPIPDEIVGNLASIKEVMRAMDIPVVEEEGVEADDVIGTLARKAEADGEKVVIVSADKDFQQLLSDRISMFRPAYRGDAFDPITETSFREKFELEPIQFIDVLALMGDASDNVPGVPGIGEKTAVKLVKEYGTVESLLEHADDVSGKRAREGLQQHRDDALLSKKLVTILTDVPVTVDWKDFKRADADLQRIKQLFADLEFTTLTDRTLRMLGRGSHVVAPAGPGMQSDLFSAESGGGEESFDADAVSYRLVRNLNQLDELVSELQGVARLAVDTETTSRDPMLASLVGISLSWGEGQAAYVPTPLPDDTATSVVLDRMRPLLESDTPMVGHNLKYDEIVFARHGVTLGGDLFDTMVAHYLVAPEESHGLDALALRYFSYRMMPISTLIGSGKTQISMRDVPSEKVAPYACEDADFALRLADHLDGLLGEDGLNDIAQKIEFPLMRVLARMERTGIRLDTSVLDQISEGLGEDIAALETAIYEAAGQSFNIGSTQQLGEILFEKLNLPVVGKTSTGKPSTRENVLQTLALEHELPALILDWRELSKLKSTYVDTLGALVHPETGRIHTSFNQTVAATGRLSSADPNLQNIPVRTARGREIRKAFVPEEGWTLLSADYAQIELRILASLSGDEALQQAFRDGEDIHTATAARVFGCDPGDIDPDQRRKAKEVNYGIPYGVSAFGLAQRLRCSRTEAQELIDGYFKSFPGVSRFLTEQVERARETGYSETMLGRRRYVPNVHARNRVVRSAAERVAVNMPIQGSQADMIKIAMIAVDRRLREEGLKTRMLLQVHDELVLEVPPAEVGTVKALVRNEMEQALPLKVPVEVGMDTGDNWLDAH
ncbi:MAG: DNA polymerase I [Rhodothermales bacterium]|nr:DNA polymerase I [Rhodothermales bacterium]MBO6779725.1 DNA polymerase I [Rhodothermales bacterium]